MDAESETLEEATLARDEIALMDKCLRGIATPEERAEYLVKLNGFTFDERFGRKVRAGLKPCGCGGSKLGMVP